MPVEAGLGFEENFLSLGDILMSQERLPCRAETALPRLAAVLGKAGPEPLAAVPEVTGVVMVELHLPVFPRLT